MIGQAFVRQFAAGQHIDLDVADANAAGNLNPLDGGGRAIIVVIADDDPDFVITTFPDD